MKTRNKRRKTMKQILCVFLFVILFRSGYGVKCYEREIYENVTRQKTCRSVSNGCMTMYLSLTKTVHGRSLTTEHIHLTCLEDTLVKLMCVLLENTRYENGTISNCRTEWCGSDLCNKYVPPSNSTVETGIFATVILAVCAALLNIMY